MLEHLHEVLEKVKSIIAIEIRWMVACEDRLTRRGYKGIFWSDGNFLYIARSVGYTGAYVKTDWLVLLRHVHYMNFTTILKTLKNQVFLWHLKNFENTFPYLSKMGERASEEILI